MDVPCVSFLLLIKDSVEAFLMISIGVASICPPVSIVGVLLAVLHQLHVATTCILVSHVLQIFGIFVTDNLMKLCFS